MNFKLLTIKYLKILAQSCTNCTLIKCLFCARKLKFMMTTKKISKNILVKVNLQEDFKIMSQAKNLKNS